MLFVKRCVFPVALLSGKGGGGGSPGMGELRYGFFGLDMSITVWYNRVLAYVMGCQWLMLYWLSYCRHWMMMLYCVLLQWFVINDRTLLFGSELLIP